MPPKKKYTKEQIIDKAFEIAKDSGINSISIRKVAEKLGSSIAPIYVNFKDVDELIGEVVNKTFRISKKFLDEQSSGNPFKDIGIASIRFAKEYPILFRDIVLNQRKYIKADYKDLDFTLIKEMKKDPELEGFTDEELRDILLKMRVFHTGLSIMASNSLFSKDLDDEKVVQLLDNIAEDIIFAIRRRKLDK